MKTKEIVNYQEFEKGVAKLTSFLELPILLALLFYSEKFGYGDDANFLLEGSGHSVFTVALVFLIINLLTISEIQEVYKTKEKILWANSIGLFLEFAPMLIQNLNSVTDIKDAIWVVISSQILYLIEKFLIEISTAGLAELVVIEDKKNLSGRSRLTGQARLKS